MKKHEFERQHYYLYDINKRPRGCVLLVKDGNKYYRSLSLCKRIDGKPEKSDIFYKTAGLFICGERYKKFKDNESSYLFNDIPMNLNKSFINRKKNQLFYKNGTPIDMNIILFKISSSETIPLTDMEKKIVQE